MALRSATAPDLTYLVTDMEPGDQLVFTDPDKVLDNQDWCTQRKAILAIDCFYPITTTSAAYVTIGRPCCCLGTQADYVGAAATTAAWRLGVLCWTNDGATTFDIQVVSAGGNDAQTFVGTTTPTWRTIPIVNAAWDIRTGTINFPLVKARRTAGTGSVYVAGFGIMV